MNWRRVLPRGFAIWLGLRRVSPGKRRPGRQHVYEVPGDTGGAWRPDYRMQDPSRDPKEPYGGESGASGENHGWSNCTMAAGAMAYAYHVHDQTGPWGGDLRHSQSDLEGGTDLYDLERAWVDYGGQDFKVKSGSGWNAVVTAHEEDRAIVIQGTGNVPGSATFDGGHACVIGPETNSDGKWLWGDPLATGWQWVTPSSIRDWAERWSSGIAFGVSKAPTVEPPPPDPEPECPDCPDPQDAYDRGARDAQASIADKALAQWLAWLEDPRGFARWDRAVWHDVSDLLCDEPSATWWRGRAPEPVASALAAIGNAAKWNNSTWAGAIWI